MNKNLLLLLFIPTLFACDQEGIFPYDHERDKRAVEQIIVQSYHDIFSNSVFDPDGKTPEARLAYARLWTSRFKDLQKDPSPDNHVNVMRHNDQTVGYIRYGLPSRRWSFLGVSVITRGLIGQLGVDTEHRGKKFGEQLCNHALEHLKERGLGQVRVLTTTEEIGRKFYVNKLGFKYHTQVSPFPVRTSTTYIWKKDLVPAVSLLTKILRVVKK